jgi:hypothetical protein
MHRHTSSAAGQKNGPFNQKKNYIFVINDVISYEAQQDDIKALKNEVWSLRAWC